MPISMKFSPRVKPSSNGRNVDGTSMNVGNKIGHRSSTAKGAYAYKNESGGAMKSLLGQVGDDENQAGNGPSRRFTAENPMRPSTFSAWGGGVEQPPPRQHPYSGGVMKSLISSGEHARYTEQQYEPEYPLPGCRATCDSCGVVTNRFYHCTQCNDPDLFDLCPTCCAALYLPAGRRPPGLKVPCINHPTHDLAKHHMELVAPP